MVDSDIELDALLASSNFESNLANHVHPHMHSFPYPIGERFSDVSDLIAPNGRGVESEKRSDSGEGHCRHFLDDILPIFRNGYAICMGKSFSPSNSGLNIDPRTFTFRARADDILRYFPEQCKDTERDKESSTSETISPSPLLLHPESESESKTPTLGGESMICYPPSEYTETFLREISDDNSSPVPPIPTGTDDFGYVKKQSVTFSVPDSVMSVRDSIICHPPSLHQMSPDESSSHSNESSPHSNESSPHSNESQTSLESECKESIDRFTKLYSTPRSKLSDESFEAMHGENVKSFVVSQTWLTGWIRQLYVLDDVINRRTKP